MAVLLLSGCAPGGASPTSSPPSGAPQSREIEQRTLILALEREPASISIVPPNQANLAGSSDGRVLRPFNAFLELVDGNGDPHPYLAESLPKLGTDSWQVFPDGSMETRYRFREGIAWHDGTPFSPEDYAFAWRVMSTPSAGFTLGATVPMNLMESVAAPDSRSLVVRWRQLYADAAQLQLGGSRLGLPIFPRHILEAPFGATERDTFLNHPYWTREFIGLGPYKLDRWDPGVVIEGNAFGGHILGAPKIPHIRFELIPDANTVVANVRAGTVDVALASLKPEVGEALQQDWVPSSGGTVLYQDSSLTQVLFQFRPDIVSPSALLDVRVRKALAYAIDKAVYNDVVSVGHGTLLNSIFLPSAAGYPVIDAATNKYPLDLAASERWIKEAGFTRGPDGIFVNADGLRLNFEFSTIDSQATSRTVVGSMWRKAGLDAQEAAITGAAATDPEARSTFRAVTIQQPGADENNQMAFLTSTQISTAENRWRGTNRGGWNSPDFDRLVDALNNSLDPGQRIQQRALIARHLSEELPVIMMTSNVSAEAIGPGLYGPGKVALRATGEISWNIDQWEWR
ncbi:MAG TPA: ABC transporter substrate-binding protein [Chloroflexota bacterium]